MGRDRADFTPRGIPGQGYRTGDRDQTKRYRLSSAEAEAMSRYCQENGIKNEALAVRIGLARIGALPIERIRQDIQAAGLTIEL